MTFPGNQNRRALMASLTGLSLGSTMLAAASADTGPRQAKPSALVAFFSRTGNTRVVAGLIQRAVGADVFEIVPATPYPEEYLATVEQARLERDQSLRPELVSRAQGMEGYETVFLGFPIWGETAPPVIRTFLSSHDLSRKTIVPFVTHGGYGLGSSESVIARHAPKARLRPGFSMRADQERQTMERVNGWIRDASIAR